MSPHGGEAQVDPPMALAAERTLLAWIRTGITLMGFGFLVARFELYLKDFDASKIGTGIAAAGILVSLWASVHFHRRIRRMKQGEPFETSSFAPVAIGVAIAVGGATLVFVLLGAVFSGERRTPPAGASPHGGSPHSGSPQSDSP